jgi:hypothetical protein
MMMTAIIEATLNGYYETAKDLPLYFTTLHSLGNLILLVILYRLLLYRYIFWNVDGSSYLESIAYCPLEDAMIIAL